MSNSSASEKIMSKWGIPRTGYLVPAHGTPGVLPDGQSCWDVVVVIVAVSWCYRGAIAPRTPHPAWLARNKSWPKWSRNPSVPIPWSWNGPEVHRCQSFSISRFTGPQNAWSSDAQSISSDTQQKRYKFRHPKYIKFRHKNIGSDTQNISSDTQNTVRYLKYEFKI